MFNLELYIYNNILLYMLYTIYTIYTVCTILLMEVDRYI